MEKIDYRKVLKALYSPPATDFVAVDVPNMRFVKLDGRGDPNTSPSYRSAGLWGADDLKSFTTRDKDRWHWTMLIMTPDFVDRKMFDAAVAKASKKFGAPPNSLRLEPYAEGLSLQILHVGSYDDEGPVLARLHDEVMPDMGLTFNGMHHEIYLGDPRRTEPSRLKTVLRQPVKRVGV